MLDIILARLQQKYRTIEFPEGPPPELPERFLGRPVVDPAKVGDCGACSCCPTGALNCQSGRGALDLGKCIFCGRCAAECPRGAVTFTRDYRLSCSRRADLEVRGDSLRLATAMGDKLRRILGRSLKLRQVSAGGCNACEADANVLTTVGWDLGRFGINFVASPRHADGLLVTGPVTANMRQALLKTYEATPEPRVVIASGACAISGGPYIGHPEVSTGLDSILPVDLFVPGCPPHPVTLLDGLLRLIGRVRE